MSGVDNSVRSLTRLAADFIAEFVAISGRKAVAAALLVLAGATLEGVGLALIVPLLGIVIGPHGSGRFQQAAGAVFAALGVETPFGRLALLLGIFSALMILRALVIRSRDVMLMELQIGFVEAKRGGIVTLLAAAGWDKVVGLRHARISHLMSGDVQRIGVAAHFMLQSATALMMLAIQAMLALALSPPLAAIAFALVALAGVALVPILRRAGGLGSFVTRANLVLLDSTAQFLGGLKLAMSQNMQARFAEEFRATLATLSARQIENLRQNTSSRLAVTTVSALAGAVLVLIGYGWFALSPAVLITLLLVIGRMSGPTTQVQQGLQQVAFALPAYGEVQALERELAAIAASAQAFANEAAVPVGPIVFDTVCFRHGGEGDGRGVEDISLTIRPGEFVGIAGPSGAGKTTFLDLLVGLYPPQSGQITVGGKALEENRLEAWRRSLSYVPQDPFLFHDSIRRNLAWAAPGTDEAAMWKALELVGADRLVRGLPQGLETIVGERGTLVSGGERQRIALARALLRRPQLLVLDEATSAIDVDGERVLLERLKELAPRPTIVVVAHREASLAFCDRIVRFADGRLR